MNVSSRWALACQLTFNGLMEQQVPTIATAAATGTAVFHAGSLMSSRFAQGL
jgi:hypothetical protein